jgi:hypothetical protein
MHHERFRAGPDSDFWKTYKNRAETKSFDTQFLGWFKTKTKSPRDRRKASILDRLSRNRVDRLAFDSRSES